MSANKLKLSTSKSGNVLLAGDITHETVMSVLNTDVFASKSKVTIDFAGVKRSDSSGLALMARWARQARKANVEIYYEHVPVKLVALAKMSGLDSILIISPKQNELV